MPGYTAIWLGQVLAVGQALPRADVCNPCLRMPPDHHELFRTFAWPGVQVGFPKRCASCQTEAEPFHQIQRDDDYATSLSQYILRSFWSTAAMNLRRDEVQVATQQLHAVREERLKGLNMAERRSTLQKQVEELQAQNEQYSKQVEDLELQIQPQEDKRKQYTRYFSFLEFVMFWGDSNLCLCSESTRALSCMHAAKHCKVHIASWHRGPAFDHRHWRTAQRSRPQSSHEPQERPSKALELRTSSCAPFAVWRPGSQMPMAGGIFAGGPVTS